MRSISVLGIPLYVGNLEKVTSELLSEEKIKDASSRCISATGAHGLVFSKKNDEFKTILKSFYLNLPDGMPGVWIGQMKGEKSMKRCYGPDFFMEAMKASSQKDITHFLCGGQEGVADKLKKICEDQFGAAVVGTFCPPFLEVGQYPYKSIAENINESKADFIWIGLSSPKQEVFASHLAKYTNTNYICCVGAAFDFHIGNVRQAPSWIQKIGLEWFFRLLMEPRRLWKRYLEIVPLFIYYNFAELFQRKFFKK